MRLLIVSVSYWSGGGCFGSTYSSIFGGIPGLEIAQVYFNLRLPVPETPPNVTRFFRIGVKQALSSILTRRWAGSEVQRADAGSDTPPRNTEPETADCTQSDANLVAFFRRNHWTWLKWLNYWLTAKFGRWQSPRLRQFIEEFRPDAIWVDATPTMPSLAAALYIKKLTGLPLTGYVYDEHYSLKRLRFSPAFWLYRFACRPYIRRVFRASEFFYTISQAQKEYYEKKFGTECRILTRCADFSGDPPPERQRDPNEPLTLLYTGNLSNGRGETILCAARALRRVDAAARIDVYSAQPAPARLLRVFEEAGNIRFQGALSGAEAVRKQRQTDILLFVEGTSLSYRLAAQKAFSTKIVDYLHAARPILAVGPREMNSIAYFDRHGCGLTAETEPEITGALKRLLADPGLQQRLTAAAWRTGQMFHDRAAAQRRLGEQLESLARARARAKGQDAFPPTSKND